MSVKNPKHTSQGRVTKQGEMWLTIRIPEVTGQMLSTLAKNNERSLSYTARVLLLAQVAALSGVDPSEILSQLRIPESC